MAAPITNGHSANPGPKITLYTNHNCPYAHRAHITLEELKLPFEEVIIDLSVPREQWYLDINPRGLVPTIKYTVEGFFNEEIITESTIVAQFLADSFPSEFLPATRGDPTAPLRRARINFFVDTFNSKVSSQMFSTMTAGSSEEREKMTDTWVRVVEKEMEPLLSDAKPFFGGSEQLTFAEAITAPFIVRWEAFSRDGEFIPKSFWGKVTALPNFGRWAKAVMEKESVMKVFSAEEAAKGARKVVEKRRAAAAASK